MDGWFKSMKYAKHVQINKLDQIKGQFYPTKRFGFFVQNRIVYFLLE